MRKLNASFLFILLIISFSICSYVYSSWLERISISGVINTGDCDLDFSCACIVCTSSDDDCVDLVFSSDQVIVYVDDLSSHWILLMGSKLLGNGSVGGEIYALYVSTDNESMFSYMRILAGFFDYIDSLPIDPASYPMFLRLGYNAVKPHEISLDNGEKIVLGLLLFFDADCAELPTNSSFTINIDVLYRCGGCRCCSWNDHVTVTFILTVGDDN